MRFAGVLLAVVLCAGACTGISGPDDVALAVELTASAATASIGSPITFRFEARGNSLEGVALDYGDGAVDSVATYLARTAAGNYPHGYGEPGAYRVLVTVVETGGQRARDSVFVTVTQGQASRPRPAVLTGHLSRVY
jgi:hypothetical protein